MTTDHGYDLDEEVARADWRDIPKDWLSRIDKDAKEARDKRIFGLWLACHTDQEIADIEGMARRTVADQTDGYGDIGKVAESAKAAAQHAVDFDPPIYNIWSIVGVADQYQAEYGRWTGRCGACGRALTDPASKMRGIGPDCAGLRRNRA